jgi:hypothetical protein
LRRAFAVVTQKPIDFLKFLIPYPVCFVLVEKIGVLCGDSLKRLHPVGDQLAFSRVSEIGNQPLS